MEQEKNDKKVSTNKLSKFNEIKQNLVLMEKSLSSKEYKQFQKQSQQIKKNEKNIDLNTLIRVLEEFSNRVDLKEQLIDYKNRVMKMSIENGEEKEEQEKNDLSKQVISKLKESVEINIYLSLVVMIFWVERKEYREGVEVSEKLMKEIKKLNMRHLDFLVGTLYFYYAILLERTHETIHCRSILMEAYRNACVHNDHYQQATLINVILRIYLITNNIDQASQFINKTNFPPSQQNHQFLRYLFYTAWVKSIQLDYEDSYQRIVQVIRKAPEKGSIGFKTKVQKLGIIVEMLMGDVPSKQTFTQSDCKHKLYPYYKLTQAVYQGKIQEFEQVVNKYKEVFIKDKYMNLIKRLIINVIKLGFRKINLSYSKISFRDISEKLGLKESDDIEFIIAKQIRDGVIQAEIDHENQIVIIKEQNDVYSTEEPSIQFSKRIHFCLNLYQQSNSALQYPDFHPNKLPNQPHQQTEEELAQEIVNEMEEGSDAYDNEDDF